VEMPDLQCVAQDWQCELPQTWKVWKIHRFAGMFVQKYILSITLVQLPKNLLWGLCKSSKLFQWQP